MHHLLLELIFFLMLLPLPRSTLFPYTTLFRSQSMVTRSIVGSFLNVFGLSEENLEEYTTDTIEFYQNFINERALRKAEIVGRSEEHTSELQSRLHLVCRLLLEKKNKKIIIKNN